MSTVETNGGQVLWFLEGLSETDGTLRRIPILAFPFRIGRRDGLGLTLSATEISGEHAAVVQEDGKIFLRDLNSTNGTFLNGVKVNDRAQITEGDTIHFARLEYRLSLVAAQEAEALLAQTIAVDANLPQFALDKSRILRELMNKRAVVSVFQPIVALSDLSTLGYEVLGRGDLEGATTGSKELFNAAKILGAEAALSRMFRARSAEDCYHLPEEQRVVFMNTHPNEIGTPQLIESLEEFHQRAPEIGTVLEIHEASVIDPATIGELRKFLHGMGMQLAYDDFGAGQARLLELAEVPPDYLKFDISLIRDIDTASQAKQTVLARLVSMAVEIDIQPIAEGIESEAEAKICRDLGFVYGQGFLFGAPAPASELKNYPDRHRMRNLIAGLTYSLLVRVAVALGLVGLVPVGVLAYRCHGTPIECNAQRRRHWFADAHGPTQERA